LSNGYGEDKAAAAIASKLREIRPSVEVTGAPLVTPGDEFSNSGFDVLMRGEVPPSGGFPLKSFKGFVCDTPFIPNYCRYYRQLRRLRSRIDFPVVVGDLALLMIAYYALRKKPVFVDLAKSSYKGPHLRMEESILRKLPCKVITRDQCTSDYLRSRRVDAIFLGNPMMDGLIPKGIELGNEPIVGILPGSRAEAYENLRKILLVIERTSQDASFACALPGSLSLDRIASMVRADGWALDGGMLRKDSRSVSMVYDGFPDVIARSQVIIGLAGSANEQAVGMGTPVISFAGTGAQTTAKRMEGQQRLLGESVKFVRNAPDGVVDELSCLLSDPEECARRGRIGIQRMGPPGGSEAIARFLIEIFGLAPASQIAA